MEPFAVLLWKVRWKKASAYLPITGDEKTSHATIIQHLVSMSWGVIPQTNVAVSFVDPYKAVLVLPVTYAKQPAIRSKIRAYVTKNPVGKRA